MAFSNPWESDDEDDSHDEDFGSPAMRDNTKKAETKTTAKAKQKDNKPKPPKSPPRRQSIGTLDGATSSPSMAAFGDSSQGTMQSAEASPCNNNDQVILINDDDESTKSTDNHQESNDRKRGSDSLLHLPAEPESSPFALNKVNDNKTSTSPSRPSKKAKRVSTDKDNKKKTKKSKKSIDSNTAEPTTMASSSESNGGTARVSLSPNNNKTTKQKAKEARMMVDVSSKDETSAQVNAKTTAKTSPLKMSKKKTKKSKTDKQLIASTNGTVAAAKENKANASAQSTSTTKIAPKEKTAESTCTKNVVTGKAKSPPPHSNMTPPKTAQQSINISASKGGTSEEPKKKKKKLTLQDQVFQHMYFGMKPFTLKSLATAINQTEQGLKHVMLSLTDKGLVAKKDFNSKQQQGRTKTLYWAVDGVRSKEVGASHAATPAEYQQAKQKLRNLQSEISCLRKTMADIQSDLSNQEVEQRLQQEEAARNEIMEKIQAIRARMKAPLSKPNMVLARKAPLKKPATQDQLKRRINHLRDEWKQRKQKCMDFCDQLSDAMEKKTKDVVKLVDVETDEMCNVTLPAKYHVEPVTQKKR